MTRGGSLRGRRSKRKGKGIRERDHALSHAQILFPLLTPAAQAREVASHGYLIVFFDLRKSRNAALV